MATKAISECFIKPEHETEQSRQPYNLVAADIIFFNLTYIQRGFLYTKPLTPNSFKIESLLEKLKRSLSHALVLFYPLAGRFVSVNSEDGGACSWIYLDCNRGPGARFIHAACAAVTIDDVVLYEPDVIPVVRSFFELGERDVVNYDGHTRALLSVQVTELIDGVFIGFSMNHSVADGPSFWNFVNTLSEIFRSINDDDNNNIQGNIKVSQLPTYKRIFPDGYGPIIKLPYPDTKEYITKSKSNPNPVDLHLRERIFHFTSSSVAKLKAQANVETRGQISSFQSLSAFVWRSITRARNLGPQEVTGVSLVADARARFDPPLSPSHFGNTIFPIQRSCEVGDLLGNELGWAATLIHRAVVALDDKSIRDFERIAIESLLKPKLSGLFVGGQQSSISIGGSVRLNTYGPEFGLGKAVAVRMGNFSKSDGNVNANPGREGGGSVDLVVTLYPKTMDALERDQEFMSFVS